MGDEVNELAARYGRALDGGYGWVVVFASFAIRVVIDGITYSSSNFFKSFENEFHESKTVTSLIFSLLFGLQCFIGPFAGILIKKVGCRILAVTGCLLGAIACAISSIKCTSCGIYSLHVMYGIVTGACLGFAYLSSIVVVIIYFTTKRSLAIGISSAGSAVGMIATAPMIATINSELGWRNTFLIMSVLIALCGGFALLFKPLKKDTTTTEEMADFRSIPTEEANCEPNSSSIGSNESFSSQLKDLWTDPVYILYQLFIFFSNIGFFIPGIYLVDRSFETGASDNIQAKYLMSYLGVGSIIGRIGFGYMADLKQFNRLFILAFVIIMSGLSTALSSIWGSFWQLIIFSVVFGLFSGGYVSLISVILTDIVHVDKMENAYGFMALIIGLATAIGAPLVGYVYTFSGKSYPAAFAFSGASMLFSAIFLISISYLDYPKKSEKINKILISNKSNEIIANS